MTMSISILLLELISRICNHLEKVDFFNLRLACKATERGTFDDFAKRYYENIVILLTPRNLEFVAYLANHEELRKRVRRFSIVPALFEGQYDLERLYFQRKCVSADVVDQRFRAYQEAMEGHLPLLLTEKLKDVLIYAFARFPRLMSVGLKHQGSRQIESEPLLCTDWRRIKDETGLDPASHWPSSSVALEKGCPNARTIALSALLSACIANGIKPREINSCNDFYSGIIPGPLYLSAHKKQKLPEILSAVQKMHFYISVIGLHHDQRDRWPGRRNAGTEEDFEHVSNVLSLSSPSLEKLSFRIILHPQATLTGLACFSQLSTSVYFQHLSYLDIWSRVISLEALCAFLQTAAPTLQELHMSNLSMSTSLTSSFDETQIALLGKSEWRRFYSFLKSRFSLSRFDLSNVTCVGANLRVVDPVHGRHGTNPLVQTTNHLHWDAKRAKVGFDEWIDASYFERGCGTLQRDIELLEE